MMNKYLEKVAFKITPAHTAALGALAGGVGGAYVGYKEDYKEVPVSFFRSKRVKLTKEEKVLDGIAAGIGGTVLGASLGAYAHPTFRKQYHSGYYHRQHSAGNTHTSRAIHDIHQDLGKTGGFKTKKEATDHFRKARSKLHPDRHPGKEKEMHENMAKLNRAWDEFHSHPEGFTKLANAYLEKIAAIDFNKVKTVIKANPIPTALGTALGADGLLSTTRKKNESQGRFRLRQLRNTVTGAGTGVASGYVAQKALEHVTKK
jgi:hypothetical protein